MSSSFQALFWVFFYVICIRKFEIDRYRCARACVCAFPLFYHNVKFPWSFILLHHSSTTRKQKQNTDTSQWICRKLIDNNFFKIARIVDKMSENWMWLHLCFHSASLAGMFKYIYDCFLSFVYLFLFTSFYAGFPFQLQWLVVSAIS